MEQSQRQLIIKLNEVKDEKGLTIDKILALIEKNGDFVSRTTVARVFQKGAESKNFRYDDTLRPIAKALLDMETIEDDDDLDVKALKALMKYKGQRIEELERQIAKLEDEVAEIKKTAQAEVEKQKAKTEAAIATEKNKIHEKLEKQRAEMQSKIDLLEQQIARKDRRMDQLFGMNEFLQGEFHAKDKLYTELVQSCIKCKGD